MKEFCKNSIAATLVVCLVFIALGFTGPIAVSAATTPSLGAAATYGILAGTYTNTVAGTTINGDLGYTTGPATVPTVNGTNYGAGAPTPTARTNAADALTNLNSQACTFTFAAGAIDLATDTTHGTAGVYAPGVYCTTGAGAASIGTAGITLSGAGTYIFRVNGALTSVVNSTVTLASGASASDVFWTPTAATTLGANTTFKGTIIDNANAITVGANTTWIGRALSLGAGTVTTDTDTITVPITLHVIKTVVNNNGGTAVASDFTINVSGTNVSPSSFAGSAAGVAVTLNAGSYSVTEPVVPTGYLQTGSGDCSGTIAAGETKTCTITNDDIAPQLIVNKVVVNDNGGTKVISDFPLFIDGGSVTSGVASTTTIGLHTVSETSNSGYAVTIGGNCAADGTITLALGDVKTCTVTNDDIAPVVVPPPSSSGGSGGLNYVPVPPLIDVVKVPSPLALPDGPGAVKYTYTLQNIGMVSVANVTMVGDTCSPIALISGDPHADAILDVNETWVYTCSTILTKTHTNIVTATGWANGITATDIANATVIVGVPVVPPLIHVTKVPSPLVLTSGGGVVTYTNKVTNPGTVALSNVRLTDDKCSSVIYVSGDTNGNSMLDITETWTYTCSANLTKTTVNTVTASGDANGLTARDFAIATIVVATSAPAPTPAPQLPSTGVAPDEKGISWNIVMLAGLFMILIFYLVRRKQAI